MATKKPKKATKGRKAKALRKAKKLEANKPLVSLAYEPIKYQY
jgi:hypothetical protein